MISALLYTLIASLFVLDWLFLKHGIGVRQITWIPEIISILIAVSIPFRTAFSKKINIPMKYTLLIGLYLSHIVVGFLLNDVNGWVVLSGVRIYAKFLPVFILLMIYPYADEKFRRLILFVFILSMLQFPVVLWQRFVAYSASLSGDPIGGTLGHSASGVLAIYLLTVLSFIVAFYFKGKISFPLFILAMIAAFLPITLNETKITFVLLPISFIFPALFLRAQRAAIFRVILVLFIFSSSFFVLKGIYDFFQQKRWGYGIATFVSMPGRLDEYSQKRVKPIVNAFKNAKKDVRFLIFGRGAGNVSEGFTKKLDGRYVKEGFYYGAYSVSYTTMVWEIGYLGLFLFFLFPFFVFMDAVEICKREAFSGAFSLGMLSYCLLFVLSFFYTDTLNRNIFVYTFFLTAGYIVTCKNREFLEDDENEEEKKFHHESRGWELDSMH